MEGHVTQRRALPVIAVIVAALVAAGPVQAKKASFVARGSAEQVQLTGAKPGVALTLVNRKGTSVSTLHVGKLGGLIFHDVKPGSGYRVRQGHGRSAAMTPAFTVMSDRPAPPNPSIYKQRIPTSGYGYLTTRDGTQLAIDVHLPTGGQAPYPTLIEYAGYGYADPYKGPDSGIAQIANLLGFAVVDVNMRGTGCSGGAYDYFEPLQGLDGYDIVETVAHQPWVLGHKVGMMGVSFGGISQLFVAETRPPDLEAIAPLSVIDNTATTLYPGGILNTGFAVSWAKDRVNDAKPATATTGQSWAFKRIQGGDATCKANQALHAQAPNELAKVGQNAFYVPKVADPLAPITFVGKITVPTFMACQFTDEQTGGHCPDLAEHFTGTSRKWFTFTNGVHTDSLDPATFNRWFDFLELYVAHQRPQLPPLVLAEAPVLYQTVLGVPAVTLPPDPIQAAPTFAAAMSQFNALPPIRILFDNGAGGTVPGQPYPGFEQSFATFPIPGTTATSWFFDSDGTLQPSAPLIAGTNAFTWNASNGPTTDFSGDTAGGMNGLWTATPPYHWNQPAPGTSVSYLSAPLTQTTTVIGAGAVEAWVKASVPDVDLQVTVSEVRPDGNETFVQNGWLRASERKLDPAKSTPLQPVLSERKADASPLPAGTFTPVTIPLYYEGHVYRAGSRLRITITAPGGSQPIWGFAKTHPSTGSATVTISSGGGTTPSRVTLPVVPGITVTTPLPPCPGLRGEPCRPYVAPVG